MGEVKAVAVLICSRVEELPSGSDGAVRRPCARCGDEVWVSKQGLAFLLEQPSVVIWCSTCRLRFLEAIGRARMQRAERHTRN
jgi:hypothetical protein